MSPPQNFDGRIDHNPYLNLILDSALPNINLSIKILMSIIKNITASTWLMSFNSLPILNKYPSPKELNNNSPAIKDLQANDQLCLRPISREGIAAGIKTLHNNPMPRAPMFFPT